MFEFSSWLRKSFPGSRTSSAKCVRKKNSRSLLLELLEDRVVPDSGGAFGVLNSQGNLQLNPTHQKTFGFPQVIPNVNVQLIFLTDSTTDVSCTFQAQLETFFKDITGNGFISNLLSQYSISGAKGTIGNGTLGSVDTQPSYKPDDTASDGSPAYSDGFLQEIIQGEINAGNTAKSDGLDNFYIIFTPPGDAVTVGGGEDSTNSFLGYHSAFLDSNGKNADYYAVIPDQTDANGNANLTEFGPALALTGEEIPASHEVAEAITDCIPITGWVDPFEGLDGAGEVGDQAANEYFAVDGHEAQYMWSNAFSGAAHVIGTGSDDIFINQVSPPAVPLAAGVSVPVATFTTANTSLTAGDFSSYVYEYDSTEGTGFINWDVTSITGGKGHFVINAAPEANITPGTYGQLYSSQEGLYVEIDDTADAGVVDGNDPVSLRYAPSVVTNTAPLNYDADSGSGTNNFVLRENSATGNFELYDNGNLVFTQPIAVTTSINITADASVPGYASANVDDSLTIDYSGGVFLNAVTFNGGPGSNAHTLTLENGAYGNVTYTYTGAHSGTVQLVNLAGTQTITFSSVTSLVDLDKNANESIYLIAGAQASLQDNGNNTDGVSEITSLNSGFFTTQFSDPTGSFTVNAQGGGSLIQLAAMDGGFDPAAENFAGGAGDVFQFKNASAVPSTAGVTLSFSMLDLDGLNPTLGILSGNGTVTDSVAGSSSTLIVGNTAIPGTFSGVIQNGSGTVGLTVNGSSAQETLTGTSNTYSGATTITAGTLIVGATNTIPGTSDVTDNGKLDLDDHSDIIGSLGGSGTVTSSVSGAVTLTVGATGHGATFSGVLQDGTGPVLLIKTGGGTETLSGTSNNYSGGTTINGGTLSISSDANLGTVPGSAVANSITILNGATLQTTNSSAITINSNRGLTLGSSGGTISTTGSAAVSYGGAVIGGTGLTKSGSGDLFLQNNASLNVPGSVSVSAGRLFLTSQDAVGAGAVSVANGAVLGYSGGTALSLANSLTLNSGADVTTRSATLTLAAAILPTSGTVLFNDDNQATTNLVVQTGVVLSGTLSVQVGGGASTAVGAVTISGAITGSGGLTKTQTGTLIVSNTGNSYSGDTTISGGTLKLGASGVIPNGAGDGNVNVAGGAVLDLGGFSQTINGLSGAGTVDNSASGGPYTLTAGNNNATSSFSGTIKDSAGSLALTKIGNGTLTLSGTSSYTGVTNIGAGILQVGAANASSSSSDLVDNATLDLDGNSDAVGALSGTGTVTSSASGSAVLTLGSANNATFSGIIQNGSGTVGLTKTGGGTEVLSSKSNSYTGATNVNAGTLQVDGVITSNVTVSSSGTLDGDGTTGSVTASSGTNVSPGDDPGVLTTGALNLQAGSAFNAVLLGNSPGDGASNYSQDVVNSGTINLVTTGTGVALNLSGISSILKAGNSYVLISNNAGNAVSGSFVAGKGIDAVAAGTPLPEGAILSTNFLGSGLTAAITYQAGSNHDNVAVVIAALTVSISNPSANITAAGPITYKVAYNDAIGASVTSTLNTYVQLLSTGNATGTLSFDSGTGASRTVTINSITGNGTLGIVILAGSAVDTAGTVAVASLPSTTFIVDNMPPTVTIGTPSASITAGGPITYSVTYADANFGSSSLAAGNITLNKTGTATAAKISVNELSATSYTVSIGGITGDGSLGISIAADTAVDQAGNEAPAAGPSGTFIVDNTPPTITVGTPSASITAGGPITYSVTYADANFGSSSLTAGNISLNKTGTAAATNIGVSEISSTSYTVTISGITGDGALGISVAADTAADQAGNEAPAAGPSGTFIVDNTPPSISFGAPSVAFANGGPVTYSVTYADANFGSSSLTTGNITLNKTGTANGTLGMTEVNPMSYTVTISSITGDGSLSISIGANTAVDQAGNKAKAAGPSTAFVVDNTPPTITVGSPSAPYAAGGPITYSVTYADLNFASSSLTTSNITLNTTGTANGTIGLSKLTGTSYTVTISGITGDGSLGISIAADTAMDKAGNEAPASGASATFVVDNTPPTITVGTPSASITAGGPITYSVTYADTNFKSSSLTTGNITLDKTGTANGVIGLSGSGLSYTVTISGITGDGTLGISIAADTAVDKANNEAPASGASSTFTVDNTAPSITFGAPSAAYTTGGPITYSITYADANFMSSSLSLSNITLNRKGSANGTLGLSGSGLSYTVTISGITGDGALGISLAADTAVDQAGNEALAAGPSPTFVVDNTPPKTMIGAPSSSITTGGPVNYTISYLDTNFASSNLTAGDITLNTTGTAAGTVGVSGSGNSCIVTISNITGDGTLGISVAADTAVDKAGNEALAAGPSTTFIVDNTPPSITIGAPSKSITANGSISYSITYADANFAASSLTTSDIALDTTGNANGVLGLTGSGTSYTATISNITGDGTLGISVAADSAVDQAGNEAPASGPSATFIVDNTPPTIAIGNPSAAITAAGPVTYSVTYADANFGSSDLTSGSITLNRTGTASGNLSVSGSGLSYMVTVSNITGDGSLGISIAGNTAVDQAGNVAPGAGPGGTFIVNNTAPAITIGSPSASIAAHGSVTYTVSYASTYFASSSLKLSDITLNNTGTANGVIALSGSGESYTVTIGSITGDGTLGISIDAGTAVDQAGNEAPAAGPSGTFIVDNTAPSVSISPPSGSIAAGGPITYSVSYADPNFASSSLSLSSITLDKTGTADGTIGLVGSATSYTVTISNITGNGSLGISVAAGTAVDAVGNTAAAPPASSTFIVDNTPPSVTIGTPPASITAGGAVTYTITYADTNFASSSLSTSEIALNRTGTANGVLSLNGSGTFYTATISGITGDGTLGISVGPDTAVDLAGNEASAAGPSETFIVDNTAPAITIGAPSKAYTAGGSVTYSVSYADANFASSSLTTSAIALDKTGTANGTIGLSELSSTSYTVTISGISGDGALGISIGADTAVDKAGNEAAATGPSATFIVDNTAPATAISSPSATITASGSVSYTVNYSDANFASSSLTTSDITLNKTGTANGTIGLSELSSTSYTVIISGISGDGTLGISIPADTAVDKAGNTALAAGPSATFVVDNTAPSMTIGAPSSTITTHGPILYSVTYADLNFASSNLNMGEVTLDTTGTATGNVTVSGSGTSYTVSVSNISGDGSLGISVAGGSAVDLAGNQAAAGASATCIVDNTAPALTISPPSTMLTAQKSVSYTIRYSDANFASSSLTTSNITLHQTGTATGTIGLSGGGTLYTVTIGGISGNGTLGISVAGNTAVDQAGNEAAAAGASGTFVVDNTPPTVSIGNPSASITAGGPITYSVTYADADFGSSILTANLVTLNRTGSANGTVAVSGSGLAYTVTVSGVTGNGALGIALAANTAVDQAGNEAPASGPSATFVVDNTAPVVAISPPSSLITAKGPITYTITYLDANFQSSTLSLANIHLISTPAAGAKSGPTGFLSFDNLTGATRTVTVSGISGNGTLGISIDGGAGVDLAGNKSIASGTSPTFIVDNTTPTVTISAPSAKSTVAGQVRYTVTYSGAYLAVNTINLNPMDVVLNSGSGQSATVNVTGSGSTRTVTLSNITGGPGALGISIQPGTAFDAAGNAAAAAGPSATFNVTGSAKLNVTSSAATSANQGDNIVYTYTITNKGTQATTDAMLDVTPPPAAVVNLALNPDWTAGSNNDYLFDAGPIAAGGIVKVTFTVSVPQTAKLNTTLTNIVDLLDANGDIVATRTSATTIVKQVGRRK